MKHPELNPDEARCVYYYAPDSESGLRYVRDDRVAGAKRYGIWRVRLGVEYYDPARLLWAMFADEDPCDREIYFLDGDSTNLSPNNLAAREVPKRRAASEFERAELAAKKGLHVPLPPDLIVSNFLVAKDLPSFLSHATGTPVNVKHRWGWSAPVYWSRDNRPRSLTAPADRIMWSLTRGEDPGASTVVHLNGDAHDNNPENLSLQATA